MTATLAHHVFGPVGGAGRRRDTDQVLYSVPGAVTGRTLPVIAIVGAATSVKRSIDEHIAGLWDTSAMPRRTWVGSVRPGQDRPGVPLWYDGAADPDDVWQGGWWVGDRRTLLTMPLPAPMTAAFATGQDEPVSPPVDEQCLVEYPEVERPAWSNSWATSSADGLVGATGSGRLDLARDEAGLLEHDHI